MYDESPDSPFITIHINFPIPFSLSMKIYEVMTVILDTK